MTREAIPYPTSPTYLAGLTDDQWEALLARVMATAVAPRKLVAIPESPDAYVLPAGRRGPKSRTVDGRPLTHWIVDAFNAGRADKDISSAYGCSDAYVRSLRSRCARG